MLTNALFLHQLFSFAPVFLIIFLFVCLVLAAERARQHNAQGQADTLQRIAFIVAGFGFGFLWMSIFFLVGFWEAFAGSSTDVPILVRAALIVFAVPVIVSFLAVFFLRVAKVAHTVYFVYTVLLCPPFLLVWLILWKKHAGTHIVLISAAIAIAASLLVMFGYQTVTTARDTVQFEQALIESEEQRVRQDAEGKRTEELLQGFYLLYTFENQRNGTQSHTVEMFGNGSATIDVTTGEGERRKTDFTIPPESLEALVVYVASDEFQQLSERYCAGSGACKNETALFTVQATVAGKKKKIVWGESDKTVHLDEFEAAMTRYVPPGFTIY